MWRENYFCCARTSTTEYNKVAWGGQTPYNIIQHRGKQKKCCIVQHLFCEKFDRDQTSYNKIQHDKTRYNKVAKRVQHFIKHQSCMMLYEMLHSFGRGFIESLKHLLKYNRTKVKTSGCRKQKLKATGTSTFEPGI